MVWTVGGWEGGGRVQLFFLGVLEGGGIFSVLFHFSARGGRVHWPLFSFIIFLFLLEGLGNLKSLLFHSFSVLE